MDSQLLASSYIAFPHLHACISYIDDTAAAVCASKTIKARSLVGVCAGRTFLLVTLVLVRWYLETLLIEDGSGANCRSHGVDVRAAEHLGLEVGYV